MISYQYTTSAYTLLISTNQVQLILRLILNSIISYMIFTHDLLDVEFHWLGLHFVTCRSSNPAFSCVDLALLPTFLNRHLPAIV